MNRKTALLDAIRYVANIEQAFISGISEAERQATGTLERWSPKDLIAHNAAWKGDLSRRLAGEELPAIEDYDDANAEIFASFQGKTWGDVVMYTLVVQNNLEAALERLDEEELEGSEVLGRGDEIPTWRDIAGTACIHPLLHLSENAIERGDPERAVRLHHEALPVLLEIDDSPQWRGNLVYNVACQYALTGDVQKAILQLGEALRLRPDLAEWSQQDSDLASLRDEPTYQALYTID